MQILALLVMLALALRASAQEPSRPLTQEERTVLYRIFGPACQKRLQQMDERERLEREWENDPAAHEKYSRDLY
jgi:hypothetical protein